MTTIDLTPANRAARDAIWRHATRDVTGSIDRATADRLGERAVRAAAPFIIEALREQIAKDLDASAGPEARRCYLGGNSQETDGQRHAASIFEFGMHTAARLTRGGDV